MAEGEGSGAAMVEVTVADSAVAEAAGWVVAKGVDCNETGTLCQST